MAGRGPGDSPCRSPTVGLRTRGTPSQEERGRVQGGIFLQRARTLSFLIFIFPVYMVIGSCRTCRKHNKDNKDSAFFMAVETAAV